MTQETLSWAGDQFAWNHTQTITCI